MNILFDLIFLKFYLHRWVAKKPNVKVLAYRILNSQIENHIKIKLDFYLSSQVSESKLGHLNILCRLYVFRGPGETHVWPLAGAAGQASHGCNVQFRRKRLLSIF